MKKSLKIQKLKTIYRNFILCYYAAVAQSHCTMVFLCALLISEKVLLLFDSEFSFSNVKDEKEEGNAMVEKKDKRNIDERQAKARG